MTNISYNLDQDKIDFIETTRRLELKLSKKHSKCEKEGFTSTLAFPEYQPMADYSVNAHAICDSCGHLYERPYAGEELARIVKEREDFQRKMSMPMTDFSGW
jgi:hypothetical protein